MTASESGAGVDWTSEMCVCGDTKMWHSVSNSVYIPSASGCMGHDGIKRCGCKGFKPAVAKPLDHSGPCGVFDTSDTHAYCLLKNDHDGPHQMSNEVAPPAFDWATANPEEKVKRRHPDASFIGHSAGYMARIIVRNNLSLEDLSGWIDCCPGDDRTHVWLKASQLPSVLELERQETSPASPVSMPVPQLAIDRYKEGIAEGLRMAREAVRTTGSSIHALIQVSDAETAITKLMESGKEDGQ